MIELSRTTSVPNAGEIILMASDIAVQFGGLKAVDGVSLEVRRGEIVGMIGANGAGKTTFFQVLSGFVKPTAGEVRFRGERIDGLAPELICRRGLTRTFQIAEVFQSLHGVGDADNGSAREHAARRSPQSRGSHCRIGSA